MSAFANLRKSSKSSIKELQEKVNKEVKGNSYSDDRFWAPEVDKTGNGYAIIRFLPEIEGENVPFVKVYNHGFKEGTQWFIENCPTSIGLPCPVCDSNTVLWKTGSKENQQIVRDRKRKIQYIANILVLQDSKHPDNEGKNFLYKFGAKIFEKIGQAIEPEFEDETPFNPFDFWEGANFKIKIRNVEGFRSYDKSEFDSPEPLLDGDEKMLEALWGKQYKLQEFLEAKQFKNYDELEGKLNKTLGISSMSNRNTNEAVVERIIDEEPKASTKPNAASRLKVEEESDDLNLYAELLKD